MITKNEARARKILTIALPLLLITIGILTYLFIAVFPSYANIIKEDEYYSYQKWDGSTISRTFSSGIGTKEEPYIISNGADLALLSSLISGETYEKYASSYYEITNNIDIDNHDINSIGTKLNPFKGIFNGNGYSLANLKLVGVETNDSYSNGLFAYADNATIKNLNIKQLTITKENSIETENKNIYIGAIVGKGNKITINNCGVYDSLITTPISDNVGTIAGSLDNSNLSVIFSGLLINNQSENIIGLSNTTTINNLVMYQSSIKNDIINNSNNNILINIYSYTYLEGTINIYKLSDNNEFVEDNNITLSSVANDFTTSINDLFSWRTDIEYIRFDNTSNIVQLAQPQMAPMSLDVTLPVTVTSFVPHNSGIEGDTLYINDLDSDLAYYQGLNYTTTPSRATIANGLFQDIYNDNNLVKIQMTYNGQSYGSNLIGYVSKEEQQSKLIYYKIYNVNTNGTSDKNDDFIEIELLDNTFIDAPNNSAFNGWVTNYRTASLSLDSEIYTRTIKIPVTYTNSIPDDIIIDLYASWTSAKISYTSDGWTNAFNKLSSNKIEKLDRSIPVYSEINQFYSGSERYYYYSTTTNYNNNYPSNSYSGYGYVLSTNQRCTTRSGCTVYIRETGNITYDPNKKYYYYSNETGNMTQATLGDLGAEIIGYEGIDLSGQVMAGFYKKVSFSYNDSYNGYFDENLNPLSGTCGFWDYIIGNCESEGYEYQNFYDENGNINYYDSNYEYYYLVTRDTNIMVLDSIMNTSWSQSNQESKTFTLTGLYNDKDYRNQAYYDVNSASIKTYADLTIEYVELYTTIKYSNNSAVTGGTGTLNYLYGNMHNVKLGRGITNNTDGTTRYLSLKGFLGTTNKAFGSEEEPVRYRQIVESGYYDAGALVNGAIGSFNSSTGIGKGDASYYNAVGIYGCDYDRVINNNNNLIFESSLSASYGGMQYPGNENEPIVKSIYKSGSYGLSKYTNTTGIYIGQRNYGNNFGYRVGIFEGGWFYVVNGAPNTHPTLREYTDTVAYIKNASIDYFFIGAGSYTSYGNKIIQMTGGMINYSLFGGSNAPNSSGTVGAIYGDTYTYVGGTAKIGNPDLSSNTAFGVEKGSVFGQGNGGSGGSGNVGSSENSVIVIDGNAEIEKNVYGGSNSGSAGSIGTDPETNVKVYVYNGTINGSVYGAGKRNGAAATGKKANLEVNIMGGDIKGSVYGGANTKGIVYGDTKVNIYGGTIEGSVYGGGQGGYHDSSNNGTFISMNTYVNIGNRSLDTIPTINGNVYAGSGFGTVNGIDYDSNETEYSSNITFNLGTVLGNIYGGSKGGIDSSSSYNKYTYKPIVKGSINVNINNGTINNVFGGNDAAGTVSGTSKVYLNGGLLESAYGGGNNVDSADTNIYLQGSFVNNLFGGGNSAGADNTNVYLISGVANSVYGGSNQFGTVDKTNVKNMKNETEVPVTVSTNVAASIIESWDTSGYKSNGLLSITLANTLDVDITNWTLSFSTPDTIISNNYSQSNIITTDYSHIINEENRYYGTNVIPANSTYTIDQIHLKSYLEANKLGIYSITLTCVDSNGTSYSYTNNTINTDVIYGGNNAGGTVNETNINIDNNNAIPIIYGGNNAGGIAKSTNINLINSTLPTIYGGNNAGGTAEETNVNLDNSIVNVVYGGNNESGTAINSNISSSNSNITDSVYGGGNLANITGNTNVELNSSTITNSIYGGGNKASVLGSATVEVLDTSANLVFGGGNVGDVFDSTNVIINNSIITDSVYGGGNSANVLGNASTIIAGTTSISGSTFAGGNSGAIGFESSNSSTAKIDILGATIGKNIYGGCNTSVVYGTTNVNIGSSASETELLKRNKISIGGTVFGGGEANASGSETYDFSFISVTNGIEIEIDGSDYTTDNFLFAGSIFGSGNASSSSGSSNIYIKNIGSIRNPIQAISVQRASKVDIDNCVIELDGATDRTNEYSSIKYSFNRIDDLIIRNNTTLLLQKNANLLKKLQSLTSDGSRATVSIAEDGTPTKNVDNRIYMAANRNLNIATNEAATSYGEIIGMTFFGMYNSYSNNNYSFGIYNMENNDNANASDVIIGGSYILGLHAINMDYKEDGFYTNYINDEYTKITTGYIAPTPENSNYYIWTIGMDAINYSFSITASKYSSLGTYELSLIDFPTGNTTFNVIGFNSEAITNGVTLVDSNEVPKIGSTPEESNSILGFSMKSETQEWTSHNTTKFLSKNGGEYIGNDSYSTDNQAKAPSLTFYLYHAKNITLNSDLGTISVTLQAMTPKNEIEYDIKLINITISLDAKNYTDSAAYDASITYGEKYEMPAITNVNITNTSQFTAYYSLFSSEEQFSNLYGLNNDNYRSLTTNYALPIGTKITMMDLASDESNPKYYYYQITRDDYNNAVNQLTIDGEATYRLSKFISMDSISTNNHFSDSIENENYYHDDGNYVMEEFLFVFDFEKSTNPAVGSGNSMILELRNNEDRTIVSVLGIRQEAMVFNLFESSNAVLNPNPTIDDNYIYYNVQKTIGYNIDVDYNKTTNLQSIIDTNYESNSMGINISLYDSSNNKVSSSMLTGTTINIQGTNYYANSDGTFRIKLANKVSNLTRTAYMTVNNGLPAGIYTMYIDLFSSNDGLHIDNKYDARTTFTLTVVGSNNALAVNLTDNSKLIDGNTGLINDGTNTITANITFQSELIFPNIRLRIYKRNTSSPIDMNYTEIPIADLFNSDLQLATDYGLQSKYKYEYLMNTMPIGSFNTMFNLKDNISTGTYKVVFELYDNNQSIDKDTEYIIVKKN